MSNIPKKIEEVLDSFIKEIETIFGNDVICVTLFGSVVSEEFHPKKSDINFLIVLTPAGIEQIGKIQKFLRKWQKRKISLPLFMTKEYIRSSLDSFPIEFYNIQCAYRVLIGEDVLAGFQIHKEDLRLQCERELKGKLLHLRQRFIMTGGKFRELKLLVADSIVTFTSIFKALLYLRGQEVPYTKHEVILAACREFTEIDESLFSELLMIRRSEIKFSRVQLQKRIQEYISQIQKLSEAVDMMEFDKE